MYELGEVLGQLFGPRGRSVLDHVRRGLLMQSKGVSPETTYAEYANRLDANASKREAFIFDDNGRLHTGNINYEEMKRRTTRNTEDQPAYLRNAKINNQLCCLLQRYRRSSEIFQAFGLGASNLEQRAVDVLKTSQILAYRRQYRLFKKGESLNGLVAWTYSPFRLENRRIRTAIGLPEEFYACGSILTVTDFCWQGTCAKSVGDQAFRHLQKAKREGINVQLPEWIQHLILQTQCEASDDKRKST